MKTISFGFLLVAAIAGCTGGNSHSGRVLDTSQGAAASGASNSDSAAVVSLLKSVYRWHAKDSGNGIDFEVIVKDSFQTGLNYDSFNRKFAALQQTHFFSSSFLGNYRALGEKVSNKLVNAHPQLLNEINFDFQESDPWTYFQDDFPDFWDHLTISDYRAGGDSASLKWKVKTKDWSSEGYAVRFRKEAGSWRVAYLAGFDPSKY
jgi:hypothetical protein